MRISRIRAVMASAALLLLPSTTLVSAPPAYASGDNCIYIGSEPWTLCVNVYGGQARSQMWFPIFPYPVDPYAWVDECDASGQYCSMVTGSFSEDRATPWVATNPAKTYRGCIDFRDPGAYYPLSVVAGCTAAVPG
jgi:hypothetical protein